MPEMEVKREVRVTQVWEPRRGKSEKMEYPVRWESLASKVVIG
jgi:hypothetical protein